RPCRAHAAADRARSAGAGRSSLRLSGAGHVRRDRARDDRRVGGGGADGEDAPVAVGGAGGAPAAGDVAGLGRGRYASRVDRPAFEHKRMGARLADAAADGAFARRTRRDPRADLVLRDAEQGRHDRRVRARSSGCGSGCDHHGRRAGKCGRAKRGKEHSRAAHGFTTFTPGPPSSLSTPGPPSRVSLPGPPSRVSLPSSPKSLSLPAPPEMVSLPAPPQIVSLPPRPAITSGPAVPRSASGPAVPAIVARSPAQRAVAAVGVVVVAAGAAAAQIAVSRYSFSSPPAKWLTFADHDRGTSPVAVVAG